MRRSTKLIIIIVGFIACIITIVIFLVSQENFAKYQTSDDNSQLQSKLDNEYYNIASTIARRYSFLNDAFQLEHIILVGDGDYAIALLSIDGSTYRALLQETTDGWKIHNYPAIVLTYADFPEVPKEIIKIANDLENINED